MTIKTERLMIRPYSDSDMEAVNALLTNDIVKKTFIVPDFATRESFENLFYRLKQDSESESHHAGGIFLSGTLVGLILDVASHDGVIELGYAIAPSYHNHGFASEALVTVIEHLFRKGYSKVEAGAFEDNLASIRVMQKSGMTITSKSEDIEYRGKKHHCVYYSIEKSPAAG